MQKELPSRLFSADHSPDGDGSDSQEYLAPEMERSASGRTDYENQDSRNGNSD